MTRVIEALIYAISTQGNEIDSVVISKDVIEEMGRCVESELFGEFLTFRRIDDTVNCVHNGRTIQVLRQEPQFYLAGIPVKISSYSNTCSIVIKNGDIIELISHIEEECEEEITFEVEEMERIWYGGF